MGGQTELNDKPALSAVWNVRKAWSLQAKPFYRARGHRVAQKVPMTEMLQLVADSCSSLLRTTRQAEAYRTLIPTRVPQIATKVADISPTIDTVASDITSVGTNIMCVGPDFPPISSQFFLGCAVPFMQSKFADVTTTVDQIRPHVASIRSYVPGVGANLSAVRA